MKTLIFLLVLPAVIYSQDFITVHFPDRVFKCPSEGSSIVYSTVLTFDSTYSTREIFGSIKPVASTLFMRPSVGVKSIFELSNISNQIISEDVESKSVVAHLIFKTEEGPDGEPDIKAGMVVVAKGTFIVKENRMKVIISDIEYYNTSTGLGVLFGAQNSLIKTRIDDLVLKAENKEVILNGYIGRRLFTVDLHIKLLPLYIKALAEKNMKQNRF